MAQRTRDIQTSWSNGVISPRVLGRTELDKYYSSAEVVRDLIVLPQGGLKRRPGSQYVADAMGPSRLIPFVFSPGVAYIIELGNKKMRFYYAFNDQAQSPSGSYQPPYTVGAQIASNGTPTQLTTPFDTSVMSLWDIQYAQQGDIMYFTHPLYPVQKLERFGASGAVPSIADTNWRLIQPTFYCPPTDEFDQDVSGGTITMTPSATTGSGVNFTASGSVFLAGDVGKFIVADTQIALITSITSATVAVCNILAPWLSTAAAGSWKLRGSPSTFAGVGAVSGGNFVADNQFGVGQIVDVYSFAKYPDNGGTSPSQTDAFRSIDVGRYVNVAGCICQIQTVASASHLTVQYLSVPENTFNAAAGQLRVSPSAPGSWTLEDAIWTGTNGYPGCCAFFQNRLFLASTTQQPKTLWASRSDDYENFAKGTNEGDALDFTISGGKLDTIQWLSGTPVQGRLAIETDAAEYIAYAGGTNGDALTPTSINVQPNSAQGGCKLLPILTDAVLIYVQRYRTKVYEFAYNIYQSSFASKDLSLYAEHLTHAGVKETAWQANPYKIIWAVTFDGRMLGMTYDRIQDVTAWHEHRTGYADNGFGAVGTGDSYLSVACIPNPSTALLGSDGNLAYAGNASVTYSSDLVWTCVQRTRNGSTVYTIELMNEDILVDSHDPINGSTSFNSTSMIQGITNLSVAGRTVIATGKPGNATKTYFPYDSPLGAAQTASNLGSIQVPMNVALNSLTAYGLPFRPTLVTRRAEARGGPTTQGVLKRWSDLWIRLYNTLGLTVNGKPLPFNNLAGVLPSVPADSMEPGATLAVPGTVNTMSDEQPPLTTDVRIIQLGYDRDGRVTMVQPQPLPVTILAMFGTLSIGDQ